MRMCFPSPRPKDRVEPVEERIPRLLFSLKFDNRIAIFIPSRMQLFNRSYTCAGYTWLSHSYTPSPYDVNIPDYVNVLAGEHFDLELETSLLDS